MSLVVNFIAAPSAGKSSLMADVFAKLKWKNVDVEMVTEYAKDLVWEERTQTFKNEIYIFAKQHHRLFRLNNKVDIIITDRPLILSCYYNQAANGSSTLNTLALEEFNKFDNLNFFVKRVKPYNPNGRNQTENESDAIAVSLRVMLNEYKINYTEITGEPNSADTVVSKILERL